MQELKLNNAEGRANLSNKQEQTWRVAGFHFQPSSLVQTKSGLQVGKGSKPDQSRAHYEAARLLRENPKNSSPCKRIARDPARFALSPPIAKLFKEESDTKRSSLEKTKLQRLTVEEENIKLKDELAAVTKKLRDLEVSEMLHRPHRTVSDLNTMHDKDVLTFFGIMGGKAGLQGMLDALNSDGALGQLNYWKGEHTMMKMSKSGLVKVGDLMYLIR